MLLAAATCVEFYQKIQRNQKETIETVFTVKLYHDRLIVKDDLYPLSTICDISYRKKSDSNAIGFFYLHTLSGVRAFLIKEEPILLLQAYAKLKLKGN